MNANTTRTTIDAMANTCLRCSKNKDGWAKALPVVSGTAIRTTR